MAQQLVQNRFDWYCAVKQDKEYYGISLTDEEIAMLSKASFKKIVSKCIDKQSFNEMNTSSKSKLHNILKYCQTNKDGKVIMQEYLQTNRLSTIEKQTLFSLRSRSFDVKSNYKTLFKDNMSCRICRDPNSYEDEDHTFFRCSDLKHDSDTNTHDIKFEDIYSDLENQIRAIKYFRNIADKRKIILELRN